MIVLTIAGVTLREALRRKVQMNLLLFGVFLVVASYFLSTLTLGEMHRILSDLGLSSMELIGTLLAVFLGASLVSGDVERRIIYPVVAKSVSRTQYLLGRYLGLSVVLLLNLAVMAAALCAVLVFEARSSRPLDLPLFAAFAGIGLQLLVAAAVALFFSCITSTTLAAIFTMSVVIAGHLSSEMMLLWRGSGTCVAKVIWYLLPNLAALSLNEAVIYDRPVPPAAWAAAAYGLLYISATLALASLAFERRDFR